MNLEEHLKRAIERWNLLESPFYQAWSQGCLPVESLAQYANEYGAFISLIPTGWESHGDSVIAEEERRHVALWRQFASALGTDIGQANVPAVHKLVETARRLFCDRVSSLGALYAFEAQQPKTSSTKLLGLREYYPLPVSAGAYFQVHVDDHKEPTILLDRMKALSEAEQTQAAAACKEMSQALRVALDALVPAG